MGIDTGTGSTRALLVDEHGVVRASYTEPHAEIAMAQPQWAEQDPGDWWRAAQVAISGALQQANVSGAEVQGIGLSGQMHGLVLLDAENRVIRPALIWCDQRSQPQVDYINETVGRDRVLQYTANPVLTGFTLPKLLWVRQHQPELFERVRKILLPKDYIRFCLTGEFASEVSDASGTSLFDVVHRQWSLDFVSALQLDRAILPSVSESDVVTGTITSHAAKLTGLREGTPVVGGGGDQAAGAVGNGIVEQGIVSCTLGTSGVVFAHMEEVAYDPGGRVHTFCHAVPNKWHVMGVTQGAGLSLQWFRNQFAPGTPYQTLMEEAATASAGSQGLYWLPYLMGERTPHLDSSARGGWIGLTARHKRADLIRSLIEGVCYSQRDGLEIIQQLGVPVRSVRASGGGANSWFWRQLLADILGKQVVTLASQEGSAYGAALISMAGTGAYASITEVCRAVIHEKEAVLPRAEEAKQYARRYPQYQQLYPALRSFFSEAST